MSLPGQRATYMAQEETRRLALRAARELAADDEPETPPEPDWDEIDRSAFIRWRRTKAEQARLV